MVAMKVLLFLIGVLAATTVAVPAAPPDPLMWIWERAWPRSQQQQTPIPIPAAKPKAVRSLEHRKTHRPAPKVAKRKWEPIPGVRPIPPIVKLEQRERVTIKKQRTAARGRLPSCAVVKREYDRMTASQRWAAYLAASSEQVAHGRRCLGF